MKHIEMPAFRQRTLKASERLARHLAASIVEGEFAEGARLPHESEMLSQLKVGRATLREALRLLEVWGLIVIKTGPGGGPTVRRPTSGEFAEQLALMLQFQLLQLEDLSDARLALEPMMARLAAERISKEEIETLRKTNETMEANFDRPEIFWEQNAIFHSIVAHAGKSMVISMIVDALKFIADGVSSGVPYSRSQFDEVVSAHYEIIEKLENGDAEGAAKAMHFHLDTGRRYIAKNSPNALKARILWPE